MVMEIYYTNGIELYQNEMKIGDRIATQEEIDIYNQSILMTQKWAEIERQWNAFTVEVNGHIYPSTSYDSINKIEARMVEDETIEWTEETTWVATKPELCNAARAIWEQMQQIKNEVLN
jgi:hypothetical protein